MPSTQVQSGLLYNNMCNTVNTMVPTLYCIFYGVAAMLNEISACTCVHDMRRCNNWWALIRTNDQSSQSACMVDGPVPKWMHSLISTNRMDMGNTLKWIRYYDIVTNISSFLSHTLNRGRKGLVKMYLATGMWVESIGLQLSWGTAATGLSTQGIVTQWTRAQQMQNMFQWMTTQHLCVKSGSFVAANLNSTIHSAG